MEWWPLQLLGVGLAAGFLNVIAGGGSFITLPMLIFMGLPPGLANGTNRVFILMQNVSAVAGFKRHNLMQRSDLLRAALPATLGAALGAWLATLVADDVFRQILASLMVVISLVSLFTSRPEEEGAEAAELKGRWVPAGFLIAGLYGGFVQAGVGFLLLGLTSMAGLNLVRGNAVKVLTVLCFTLVTLSIFLSAGMVDWAVGLWLGGGSVVGAQLGVRATVLKGHRWIRVIVTILIIVFAFRLWLG